MVFAGEINQNAWQRRTEEGLERWGKIEEGLGYVWISKLPLVDILAISNNFS